MNLVFGSKTQQLSSEQIEELVEELVAKRVEEELNKRTSLQIENIATPVEEAKSTEVEEVKQPVVLQEETPVLTPQPDLQPVSAVVDFTPVTEKLVAIGKNMSNLLEKVEVFAHKEEINHNLHKELQTYKEGLKESFVSPLLKGIVREYDRVVKQHKFYSDKLAAEPQSELFKKLLGEFDVNSFVLLNLLSDYNIEPFEFEVGDAHNIKEQKIVEIVGTDHTDKDNTVAECVVCGFKDIQSGRLFRQAEVKIFKKNK